MTAAAGAPHVLFPWATLAALAVSLALLATLPSHEETRAARSRWWAQLAMALLALGVSMLSEAISRGWVLSQAHLLLRFAPWSGAPPAAAGPTLVNALLTDAVLQGYPWLDYTCRALAEGRVPLWTSQSFAGAPFAAPAMTAVFSPLTWIGCLAPMPWATVALALLKMVASGLGTAALARALGANRRAAALVALGGTLSPFLVVWMENASDSVAAAAPWVFAATVTLADRPGARTTAQLAASLGWLFVAGQPQTAFAVASCAALLAVLLACRRQQALPIAGAWIAAGVLGGLLASVQLLPFVEYLRESRVFAERSALALNVSYNPARALVTTVAPDFYGKPTGGPTMLLTNRHGQPTNYVEQVAYPGVTLLVLAFVGVATARRRLSLALGGVAVTALALKFGAPGLLHLASALPLLRVSPLGRFGLVWMIAVTALAALGLHGLTTTTPPVSRRRTGAAVAAAVALVAVACLAWLVAERHGLRAAGLWRATALHCAMAVALASLVGAAVLARARGQIGPTAFTITAGVLLAVELIAFARGFRPMTPPELVFPTNATLSALAREGSPFRVAGWGSALLPNAHLPYGLTQYRGYDGMSQRRYGALLDATVGLERDLWMDRDVQDSPVFDLLNVKYLIAPPGTTVPPGRFALMRSGEADVYVNRRALPRAWLVARHVVLPDDEALRALAAGTHDPRTTVILDEPPPVVSAPTEADDGIQGTARITHYADERVQIDVEAPGPRLLVLADLHYPGWVASVGDRPAPILRANYALRAVAVPAGRHTVRLQYRPRSVTAGAAITAATALLLGLMAWRWRQ